MKTPSFITWRRVGVLAVELAAVVGLLWGLFLLVRAVSEMDIQLDPCAMVTLQYASLAQIRDCGLMQ